MGYNYLAAFQDFDVETVKAASLVALMNFRDEFPAATFCKVVAYPHDGIIEVRGNQKLRTYTFEELGFKV